MTASSLPVPLAPARRNRSLVDELFRRESWYAAVGFFFAAMMVPTLLAAALDPRTLYDVNVWVKPLKFQASIALYLLTLAWFAAWLPAGTKQKRWYRVYSGIVLFAMLAEIAWIMHAAALGVPSHFNETTPLRAAVFALMGVFAIILTSASLVYGVLIARNKPATLAPALRLSIISGLILTFVLTVAVAGYMAESGSHWVGGNASDAEGLPLLGWARDGGDLRVAHFFATHAMQFIPVFGLVSARIFGDRNRMAVWLIVGAYVLFVAFTFVQALMGVPFAATVGSA